jgi:predicted amidohydrolase
MTKITAGLIQMNLKGDTAMAPGKIRELMLKAHLPLIEKAAKQGVQVLCFQEVFTQPYFCPSQDPKWYRAAEKIPDGYTTKLMQEYAKKYTAYDVAKANKMLDDLGLLPTLRRYTQQFETLQKLQDIVRNTR